MSEQEFPSGWDEARVRRLSAHGDELDMENKTDFHALEFVRSVRDLHAEVLKEKSNQEIIEFFRKAGDTSEKLDQEKTGGRVS